MACITVLLGAEVDSGTAEFWVSLGVSIVCILFAGIMSGLTLGLLSIDPLALKVIEASGSELDRKNARKVAKVVRHHHLLLVTLLLWNALANEALPLFLDRLVPSYLAMILSVSAVLLFGEIIPQAVCSRFGLAIGAKLAYLVHGLMWVSWVISYPISRLLDAILGSDHQSFYRRAELKELIGLHAQLAVEREGEGPLTKDEVTIIQGALDMQGKTVREEMTPLDRVFMVDRSAVLDESLCFSIRQAGFSRVPVFEGSRSNVVGALLIKTLVHYSPSDRRQIAHMQLKPLVRVNADTPMYEMLNEFQRGRSHMALIYDGTSNDVLGIITLEDVLEELIQEEIEDEADIMRASVNPAMEHLSLPSTRPERSSSEPNVFAGPVPRTRLSRAISSYLQFAVRSRGGSNDPLREPLV